MTPHSISRFTGPAAIKTGGIQPNRQKTRRLHFSLLKIVNELLEFQPEESVETQPLNYNDDILPTLLGVDDIRVVTHSKSTTSVNFNSKVNDIIEHMLSVNIQR